MIGVRPRIADRPHKVRVQNPGAPVSDNDGGFTQGWTDLVPPTLSVSIEAATERALSQAGAAGGTVTSLATHIVRGPYHPQVTTQTQLTLDDGRVLNVSSVIDRDQRHIDMVLICGEPVA